MLKNITCIECPKGCKLSIEIENEKVVKVSGNQCAKGDKYGRSEVENPVRILTSTVLAPGQYPRMVPVRTSKPIPKGRIIEAMERIKELRLNDPVKTGEIVEKDFILRGVNLIATRNSALSLFLFT